jgi:hypothetical protein
LDYIPATLDFEYCFQLWEKYVLFVLEHKQFIPERNYLEIRYEDLLADPRDSLIKIMGFIGFTASDQVIHSVCEQIDRGRLDNSDYAKPYRSIIPSLVTRPMMQELDYGYSV